MCPLGCGDEDNLENIITCSVLRSQHLSDNLAIDSVKLENIFLSDTKKQKETTELYRQLFEVRNKMLNNQPVTTTGPMHCI